MVNHTQQAVPVLRRGPADVQPIMKQILKGMLVYRGSKTVVALRQNGVHSVEKHSGHCRSCCSMLMRSTPPQAITQLQVLFCSVDSSSEPGWVSHDA